MNPLTIFKTTVVAALITTFSITANQALAAPPAVDTGTPHVFTLAPVIVTGKRFTASEKMRLAQVDRHEPLAASIHAPRKS